MSHLIKGVHHIALECESLEKFKETVEFYSVVLGMEIKRSWGKGEGAGVMMDTGNSVIEIFAKGTQASQGAIKHFALATDDVEACLKAVSKAGYQVTRNATEQVIPSDPTYPITFGFCIGPVGEEIEFFAER